VVWQSAPGDGDVATGPLENKADICQEEDPGVPPAITRLCYL
jgi:hypothetical protein